MAPPCNARWHHQCFYVFSMNHGETGNLSTLGGSTKTSIAQHNPVMTHILGKNLQEFSTKRLYHIGTQYQLLEERT